MKSMKPLRLLVLEDNPGDFVLLEKYLHASKIPVEKIFHVEDITSVTSIASENKFDVALLDLSLPDSEGIDSVITLDRLLPKIPIVVFSGMNDVELAIESISLGAQDYLLKGEFNEKLLAKSVHYSIERKKILEKLKVSNNRYELVNKATSDTIWEWDFQSGSGHWSENFMRSFGYDKEKLKYGSGWMKEYIHPDDKHRVEGKIQYCIASQQTNWQLEFRFRCADNTFKHVYDRGFIIYNEDQLPGKMYGSMTDISERKNLEKELANQKLKQQQLITEVTIQSQEKERNELGTELHDNINQILATVRLYLGLAKEKDSIPLNIIGDCYELVSRAIEEIRKLSHTLVAPSLRDGGLKLALQNLVEEINLSKQLVLNLAFLDTSQNALDKKMELMIYRIIQEQINNILKHANATTASVSIEKNADHLSLIISDNGIGFDTLKTIKGIGLKNIESRVEFYSGSLNVNSSPGNGCVLKIFIPC